MEKVLIIDDDWEITQYLKRNLEVKYTVEIITDFENVVKQIQEINPSLILLDLNLPNENGDIIYRFLDKKYPCLVISSNISRESEIKMLELGVNDYIKKPIDINILLLKIKNLLEFETNNLIAYKDICLDLQNFTLNDTVKLTKNEMILLQHFIVKSDEVLSKKELLKILWNGEQYIEVGNLTMTIMRLRKKLDKANTEVNIKTITQKGYILQ